MKTGLKLAALAATASAALLAGGCGGDNGAGTGGHTHVWGNWEVTVPATCESAGVETRTCELDASHQESRAIAKLTGAGCESGGGGSYESVPIGGKNWMKENLNIETSDSWCYLNSADSCAKYGRLYTWSAARAACPKGWHLPSREEWDNLSESVGGSSTAGSKLKSTNGWYVYSGISSTDEFDFSALPGGGRSSSGDFSSAGTYGYWWTATESVGLIAYSRRMSHNTVGVYEDSYSQSYGFSVRCVQD